MTYTEATKISIYKYVDANRAKINAYNAKWKKEHKETVNKARMNNYYNKKYYDYEAIAKVFRKILL